MNAILDNLQVTIDPFAIVSLIVSTITAVYVMHAETRTPLIKARHEKLIAPLFFLIEPYLYNKESPDNLFEILYIIESNRDIADGKLLECYYWCSKAQKNSFYDLCKYADKLYDKSCKRLKLKCRTISYRISRKQYKSRKHLIWLAFKLVIPYLLLLVILAFACMFVFALLTYGFTNGGIETKLLCIAILFFIFFIVYRFSITDL